MSQSIFSYSNFKWLSFFVYFIGMFYGIPYAVYAIIFYALTAVVQLFIKGVNSWKNINKLLLLPIIFYFIHIISLIYSDDKANAGFDLQVKFSFLMLPIIFLLEKNEYKFDFKNILKTYIYVIGSVSLIFLITNIIHYVNQGQFDYYMVYAKPLHPSYLSLYLVTNLLFIAWMIMDSKKVNIVFILSALLSMISLYFAESKAGLISAAILVAFVLFKYFFHSNKRLSLALIAVFIIASVSIFAYVPRFQGLLKSVSNYENVFEHPELVEESTALRLLTWDASIQVIKENLIIGVGAGDIKSELKSVYAEKNYNFPLELKMNSHNQFLETLVGQGIIGFLVLMSFLFLPLFYVKINQFLMQGFILIVSINLLFESMFNVQSGVVFIVFIYCFLLSFDFKKA